MDLIKLMNPYAGTGTKRGWRWRRRRSQQAWDLLDSNGRKTRWSVIRRGEWWDARFGRTVLNETDDPLDAAMRIAEAHARVRADG